MTDPTPTDMAWHNRRLLASDWPDGAVEACEVIDTQHPGWYATWHPGTSPEIRERGYYAYRKGRRHGEGQAYGATPDELAEAIKNWPHKPVPFPTPIDPLV